MNGWGGSWGATEGGGTVLVSDATAVVADLGSSAIVADVASSITVDASNTYVTLFDIAVAVYVPEGTTQSVQTDVPTIATSGHTTI